MFKFEGECRLCGERELLVPSHRRTGSASSSTDQRSNRCSLSPSCQATDQCTCTTATCNHDCAALAFSMERTRNHSRGDRIRDAPDLDTAQLDAELSLAFQFARSGGGHYCTGYSAGERNESCTISNDRVCDGSIESIARLASLGVDCLRQTDRDRGARGNHDRGRRRLLHCSCMG